MVSVKITTTLRQNLAEMAIEKGIKWSVALETGILKLLSEPYGDPKLEKIVFESPIAKKEKAMINMQDHIHDLNQEIEELRRKL